jgi:hypothetical protein
VRSEDRLLITVQQPGAIALAALAGTTDLTEYQPSTFLTIPDTKPGKMHATTAERRRLDWLSIRKHQAIVLARLGDLQRPSAAV